MKKVLLSQSQGSNSSSYGFVIEQTHTLPIVLVLPRKLLSNITENLLIGMLTSQDFF